MKKSAKMGCVYQVENTKKKPTANAFYYAIKLEDGDTGEEFWTMFTKNQWFAATHFWADKKYWMRQALGKNGRFLRMPKNKKPGVIFAVDVNQVKRDGSALMMHITETALLKARERAEKNLEDIPYQGKIADLLD